VSASPADQFDQHYGPNFTYAEFCCKCDRCQIERETGTDEGEWMHTPEFRAFMFKLIKMRNLLGWPFNINSGYRCPIYNDSLYEGDGTHLEGPHTIGAADVGCAFERAYALVDLATREQMGVGPTQHGKVADRFVHVDNQGPRLWTY